MSNETNHTSGSWNVTIENCGGGWNIFCGKNRIGHTVGYEPRSGSNEKPIPALEAKANAHLIAAAPDLLAACEAAFAALDQLRLVGDRQDWEAYAPLHPAYDQLRAAIAKAKNQTEL